MENEKFRPASFNCDTGILVKPPSNLWKYWLFDIEIFTCFYKLKKIKDK